MNESTLMGGVESSTISQRAWEDSYPLVYLVTDRPHYGCETSRSWRIYHNSSRPQPGKTWRLEQKPPERDSVEVQLSQGEISACCWRNRRAWMHWRQKEELARAVPHSRQHCTPELATTSLVTERKSSE